MYWDRFKRLGKAQTKSWLGLISGQRKVEYPLHFYKRVSVTLCANQVFRSGLNTKYTTGANITIHRVTQWPGQEAHRAAGKIPTIVWYDANNKVSFRYISPESNCEFGQTSSWQAVSYGAEALLPRIEEEAEDNGWFLAKNFKLHLHPDDLRAKHNLKLDRKYCHGWASNRLYWLKLHSPATWHPFKKNLLWLHAISAHAHTNVLRR